MRRDEYERSYGRRSHAPPSHPSPQEDPRSRRSRTKMKCLISIGLILPALAAVIGVAAWAISADVVMNSRNGRGNGRGDNNLLQNYAINDNRPDIFRINGENQRFQPRPQGVPSTSSTTTTTTTTTTITTTTPPPQTLSPKEKTDVNAILSKLISASGAASGSTGPRFVVVAPLPDNTELLQTPKSSKSGIARVDHAPSANEQPKQNAWQAEKSKESDLVISASTQNNKVVIPATYKRTLGSTNRMNPTNKDVNRRMSGKPMSDTHRSSKINVELTGFEPFDTMMQSESFVASPSIHQHAPPELPPPGFSVGNAFKRGIPQGHYGSRNPHHSQFNDQHMFNPRIPEHQIHAFQSNHPHGMIAPGVGLKPIQQQLHHIDSNVPLQTAESTRWGTLGFPPGGTYVHAHKPPEGISLSISSPANNKAHVSAEPVSVIKSFFLPFIPRPKLNMNARVVFGVVLDKGMGIGGKKEAKHHLG